MRPSDTSTLVAGPGWAWRRPLASNVARSSTVICPDRRSRMTSSPSFCVTESSASPPLTCSRTSGRPEAGLTWTTSPRGLSANQVSPSETSTEVLATPVPSAAPTSSSTPNDAAPKLAESRARRRPRNTWAIRCHTTKPQLSPTPRGIVPVPVRDGPSEAIVRYPSTTCSAPASPGIGFDPSRRAGHDCRVHIAAEFVALVVAVIVVTAIARRLDWSEPLCLVVVGVAASYVPGIPDYHLSPEVVLVGLLPPLLYSAAIQTSLVDFRKLRGPIASLSVSLVIFTTFAVGLVAWAVVPGLPLAAAIALGAVVAPPDAVAASAVARRVGMPRKLVRLLEGESLFNDAAALVALRTAIAAIAGSVTLWQVGLDFVLALVGGAAAGAVVGF